MPLLKYENAKLKKQFIFNLPVSKEVCGRQCPGCYALKAQIRFPKTVLPYREARYQASKLDTFVPSIVHELTSTRRKFDAVRVHESGEWYSQDYIDKWTEIGRQLPTVKFYSFTKRMKDFDFSAMMALPNMVVIDSMMHGGLNYDVYDKLDKSVTICPATLGTPTCDSSCGFCWTKVAQHTGVQFVKH